MKIKELKLEELKDKSPDEVRLMKKYYKALIDKEKADLELSRYKIQKLSEFKKKLSDYIKGK